MLSIHGLHHVAQKSSRTGFPFSDVELYGLPAKSFASNLGATLPVKSVDPARSGSPARAKTSLESLGGTKEKISPVMGSSTFNAAKTISILLSNGGALAPGTVGGTSTIDASVLRAISKSWSIQDVMSAFAKRMLRAG